MALDASLVEDVHAALLVRYTDAWVRKYEYVGEQNMQLVRDDWAEVLDGLSPEALWHALKNLPATFPPNAAEFRDLAREYKAPAKAETKRLEAPRYHDSKRWREAFERLGELQRERGPLTWAYELQEREKRGDDLLQSQRDAWRKALESSAVDMQPGGLMGAFTPIAEELLPPGMRGDQ